MSLIDRAISRIQRELFSKLYYRQIQTIEATPQLDAGEMPFTLLSMVHHRDVLSYLVAAKSFSRYTAPSRIIVICDPSIDDEDRRILRKHVPFIELADAVEFRHPDIPIGGTWERLFSISHFIESSYVVQADADTITFADPIEVREAIASQHGFVIGEEPNQQLTTFASSSALASTWVEPGAHIQAIAEWKLAAIGLPLETNYVRGCAGFTGFPQNNVMRVRLLDFSRRMREAIGERWSDWGTEQVTSNYLAANFSGTTVLPYPKYCNPNDIDSTSVFAHFIGSQRFINRKYETASRKVIDALLTQ
jgi:hypothetical protein